jgi:hypothetical protein
MTEPVDSITSRANATQTSRVESSCDTAP